MPKRNKRKSIKYDRPKNAYEMSNPLLSEWVLAQCMPAIVQTSKASTMQGSTTWDDQTSWEVGLRPEDHREGFGVIVSPAGHAVGLPCWRVTNKDLKLSRLVMLGEHQMELMRVKMSLELPLYFSAVRLFEWKVKSDGWVHCRGEKLFPHEKIMTMETEKLLSLWAEVDDKIGLGIDEGIFSAPNRPPLSQIAMDLSRIETSIAYLATNEKNAPVTVADFIQTFHEVSKALMPSFKEAITRQKTSRFSKRTNSLFDIKERQIRSTNGNFSPKKDFYFSILKSLNTFIDKVDCMEYIAEKENMSGLSTAFCADIALQYNRHRLNGRPILYIRKSVIDEFIHAEELPLEPRPMSWGETVYIQFENFTLDEKAVSSVSPSFFISAGSESLNPAEINVKEIQSLRIDGCYLTYNESVTEAVFPTLKDEMAWMKSPSRLELIDGDAPNSREIVEERVKEFNGEIRYDLNGWQILFGIVVNEGTDDKVTIWQPHVILEEQGALNSIRNATINDMMGSLANRDIMRVLRTLLYSFDRERHITVTKKGGRGRRVPNKKKGRAGGWASPPYSIVSLDTEYKARVRYVYDRDKYVEPTYKMEPHNRRGTEARVWVKEENLFENDKVDKIRIHPKTKNKLYRVVRWRSEAKVHGGAIKPRGTTEVRPWVPKK